MIGFLYLVLVTLVHNAVLDLNNLRRVFELGACLDVLTANDQRDQ